LIGFSGHILMILGEKNFSLWVGATVPGCLLYDQV